MAVVLLVDPSQTIRRVVEMVFKASGHDVVAAGSAAEGRQALSRYQPGVVLVNYLLPDGSGVRLCQAIKSDPGTASVPVIVLGGTYAPFERSEAVAAGADAVVMKPFETAQLLSPVVELLARSGGAGARPPAPPVHAGPAAGPAAQSRPPADSASVSSIPRPPMPSTAGAPAARPGSTPAPVPRPPSAVPQVPRPGQHQPPAPVPPPPSTAGVAAHGPSQSRPPSTPAYAPPAASPAQVVPQPATEVDPAQIRAVVEDLLPQIAIDTLQQMLADWLEARLRNYIYELVQQEFQRYR